MPSTLPSTQYTLDKNKIIEIKYRLFFKPKIKNQLYSMGGGEMMEMF